MNDRPQLELDEWPIERLKKHPRQDVHFGDRSRPELEALADLIRRNGMDAIDVTPAGVILSGHQRRYIAEHILKLKTVPVRIRHDLAWDGHAAEEQFFLHANDANKQLSRLQRVRNYERDVVLETERRKDAKEKGLKVEDGRVRDHVAKLYNLPRKTLDDWVPLLSLPLPVQHAVNDGRLSKEDGKRVLGAPQSVQEAIGTDLAVNRTPETVLRRHLGRRKRVPLTAAKLTRRWRNLFRAVRDLYHRRPDCFDALLPEQRNGLEVMFEFAEIAKAHFAEVENKKGKAKTPKLKLVLKSTKVSGGPPASDASPDEMPKLKLRRKDSVA